MAAAALERNLLPGSVRPLSYDILLEPDFEKQISTGNVKIRCVAAIPFQHQTPTYLANSLCRQDVMLSSRLIPYSYIAKHIHIFRHYYLQ
jgi:hypothetical protein